MSQQPPPVRVNGFLSLHLTGSLVAASSSPGKTDLGYFYVPFYLLLVLIFILCGRNGMKITLLNQALSSLQRLI